MNENLLVECRNCDNQVSRMTEICPNCKERYPSVSEEENQRYYSNCFSCGERLFINDYVSNFGPMGTDRNYGDKFDCPKCGEPLPIRVPYVPFPLPPVPEEAKEKKPFLGIELLSTRLKMLGIIYSIGILVILVIILFSNC